MTIVFDPCQQLKRWNQVELVAQIMNTVAFMSQYSSSIQKNAIEKRNAYSAHRPYNTGVHDIPKLLECLPLTGQTTGAHIAAGEVIEQRHRKVHRLNNLEI